MAKINSNNNDFLRTAKRQVSHKIYPTLLKLVNDDRVDLAEIIMKIDYLLEYTSTCIKQKDFREARAAMERVDERIAILKKENVEFEYIKYLYDGIKAKIK